VTHVPMRTCVGCRERRPQREMMRIAAPADGEPTIDVERRIPGRGAYLCYRRACAEQAQKRRSLQRALKRPLEADFWTDIDRKIAEHGDNDTKQRED
jgi:predicted RNA-binding protein YlxR (DUF448 family)